MGGEGFQRGEYRHDMANLFTSTPKWLETSSSNIDRGWNQRMAKRLSKIQRE